MSVVMRYNGVVGLRSWRIDTMGKQKRPVLEGEDDGEGHSWKVLKANGGAVDVYYGKGGHAKFQLKKADKKTAPTEELVLQRIAEHRDAKRKQQDDDEGGGGGKKAKGTRLAAEAAAVTSEAESSMSPSGSKEDRRKQTTFPHLSTPGRPDRDYDAERRSAAEKTTCVQIELDPSSDDRTPAPVSGALAETAYRIADEAVEGDLMAMETESDETVYWIVQATKSSAESPPEPAPANYKCPELGSDVEFDYGRSVAQNRPRCIEVRRLKPQTTRRGQDSVRLLEIDSQTPPFLVPTKLLREGKLKLKKIETEGRPSRSGPASIRIHYELPRGKREELESLCRMF